tara:strand:- start:1705 stop:2547 length:843 start_codon:yes stop_codon:yes gene_type:complete
MARDANTLFLRAVGGMGNRLLPLLASLAGIARSGHTLALNWPTSYRGTSSHAMKEANFPLCVSELYNVSFPTITEEEWRDVSREGLPSYGLKYTQLGMDQIQSSARPVPFLEHKDSSLVVEAHGWLDVDGEGWQLVQRMAELYDEYLKLHGKQQEVRDQVLKSFRSRPTVGVYMRQLHPKLRSWDAYGRIVPQMRQHREEDPSTLFFVISECPATVQRLKEEFGDRNIVTTPKPGIMNHPEEMKGVVVDIEVMRHVSVYYPTYGSGMARLMSALRGEEII